MMQKMVYRRQEILDFVRRWRRCYRCPYPTVALMRELQFPPAELELQLARLQYEGAIRRRLQVLGERDVELVSS